MHHTYTFTYTQNSFMFLAMATMGTLALGIGSWIKFGKQTGSIAGMAVAKPSPSGGIADIASTQLNKVT